MYLERFNLILIFSFFIRKNTQYSRFVQTGIKKYNFFEKTLDKRISV